MTLFGLHLRMHPSTWTLLPWFDVKSCDNGCCKAYTFSWVFFEIAIIRKGLNARND